MPSLSFSSRKGRRKIWQTPILSVCSPRACSLPKGIAYSTTYKIWKRLANISNLHTWPSLDSILHKSVFQAFTKHGVPAKLVSIIKETYKDSAGQIRTELLSVKIKIQKGVRQGDTLSPILLTATVEETFKGTDQTFGINTNETKLNNLRFGDDTILFANTIIGLQKDLETLNEEGKETE